MPIKPVTPSHNGRRGRPRKEIDPAFLREAFKSTCQIKVKELAHKLKVHPQTLESRLQENDIDYKFSTITDIDLDQLVLQFRQHSPNAGI